MYSFDVKIFELYSDLSVTAAQLYVLPFFITLKRHHLSSGRRFTFFIARREISYGMHRVFSSTL